MLYKYLNHYLIFTILSQLLLLMNNVNGQLSPRPRIGHDAVLVEKRLYFMGGNYPSKKAEATSDFFYYDFGMGLSNTRFVDLRNRINLPFIEFHTANIGGANQDSIFIIGGRGKNLVYQFDTKTNTISIPIIQGPTPPRREDMDSVSYGGKIYIFSGRMYNGENIFFNNFDILDTINLNWEVGSLINAPPPRFMYTATLVNGVIYYIGDKQKYGLDPELYVPLSDVCKL